jgi:hypothetical protein
MIVHEMEQYSDEWWEVRRGLPTASNAGKIFTPTGKLSAQSEGYINELIADSMGFQTVIEPTEWMTRGLELEPEAREAYQFVTDNNVHPVGFVTDDDGRFGCSPDGLIFVRWLAPDATKQGWEVKCPKPGTHVGYLRAGTLPDYYRPQVHMSMAVTGLRKWVFCSYHPGMDLLTVTVEWDEYTDKILEALVEFHRRLTAAREEL